MKEFKIYLAGACKNLSFEEQNEWRVNAKNTLEEECNRFKVRAINPNDYFNYFKELHKTNKQIKDYDMWQVRTSDLVLVNLNNSDSSVGTGQELQHAVDNGIPVIGFGTQGLYPWEVESDCQVVFDSMDECLDYIIRYYLI